VTARAARAAGATLVILCAAACGGGGNSLGGSSSGSGPGPVAPAENVVSVSVSAGPSSLSSPAVNTLYTTVTVCIPGTTTCQTIDNIQVDTGSYGLRLLAPVLTLSLPVATTATGSALVECTEFVDGYSWGPIALADAKVSGETASSVPIQLIGDARYPTVPADCSSGAPMAENTVASFGANGIIGIGPFAQDCGSFCAANIPQPAIYYTCSTASNCQTTTVATSAQVQNPVTMFTTDNNGTIILLPSVSDSGASDVTGSLIFGVGTETNNALGSVTVVPIATSGADAGFLTIVFNGATLASSFIDSGSNATFFNDSSETACTQSGFTDFYCPTQLQTLSAAFELANNSTSTENFVVVSAETLTTAVTAFPGLAGSNPAPQSFDWGLPFFFGRKVATVIEGASTADGTGPYIAF
jgi:Protein of unknown function (DUF3443)